MAGNIKLNAPSGGSVTINAVDTASNFTMSVPAAAGVLINADSATGAAQIPVGTTAQRPASPATGQLRFNSTTGATEVYNGSAWGSIGGYGVDYLVVAGGGGGGSGANATGGGGAGAGLRWLGWRCAGLRGAGARRGLVLPAGSWRAPRLSHRMVVSHRQSQGCRRQGLWRTVDAVPLRPRARGEIRLAEPAAVDGPCGTHHGRDALFG